MRAPLRRVRAVEEGAGFPVHRAGGGNADRADVPGLPALLAEQAGGQRGALAGNLICGVGQRPRQGNAAQKRMADGVQAGAHLLRPQGEAQEVPAAGERVVLRPLAADGGRRPFAQRDEQPRIQEEADALDHRRPADARLLADLADAGDGPAPEGGEHGAPVGHLEIAQHGRGIGFDMQTHDAPPVMKERYETRTRTKCSIAGAGFQASSGGKGKSNRPRLVQNIRRLAAPGGLYPYGFTNNDKAAPDFMIFCVKGD